MNQPKVSIIILNWNGLQDTIACLESLQKVTYPNCAITVVDNGSKGDDVQILRDRYGNHVHIVANDNNYGFSEGNNIGIRASLNQEADYLLLLNNDTVVAPNFLAELVQAAVDHNDTCIVHPKIYDYTEPGKLQFAGGKISYLKGRVYNIGWNEVDVGQHDQVKEGEFATGCAMLIPKDLLAKVGLFDSSYFAYFEDVDLSVRVRKAGYSIIYAPKSKIWHKGTAATGGYLNAISYYFYVRNAIRFVLKHGAWWQRLVFLAYFLLIYPCLVLGYSLIHGRFDLFKAFLHGILFHVSHKDYSRLGCNAL